MAETGTPPGSPFSSDELDVGMDKTSIGQTCPMCGSQDWDVIQDAQGNSAALAWAAESNKIYPVGTRVVALSCTRCGFLRLHNSRTFRSFIEEDKG